MNLTNNSANNSKSSNTSKKLTQSKFQIPALLLLSVFSLSQLPLASFGRDPSEFGDPSSISVLNH